VSWLPNFASLGPGGSVANRSGLLLGMPGTSLAAPWKEKLLNNS
jgi:hypothetical protein